MSRRTRTLLLPLLALFLSLLTAPPSTAAPAGAPNVTHDKQRPYAGYLFAYFTGEGHR